MTRRMISALMCLVMVFVLLPGQARATNGLSIGSEPIDDAASETDIDGKWSWDADTATLTMTDTTITADVLGIYLRANSKLVPSGTVTIVLNGVNTVTTTAGDGIVIEDSDLLIKGDGSLTVQSGQKSSGVSYGVCVAGGNITMESGTLTATAATADLGSCGVYAHGDITVQGGTLNGFGGTATDASGKSYGVYAQQKIKVENDGALNGTGGAATGDGGKSYGVCALQYIIVKNDGALNGHGGAATGYGGESFGVYTDALYSNIGMESGALNAFGGTATNASYGAYADKAISVKSGTLTATGGTATGTSFGVYAAMAQISVIGGELNGTGGTATGDDGESYGVYASNSDINVSSGTLNGFGGTATNKSYGVYAKVHVSVSGTGGTLNGTGGTATGSGGESFGVYAATDYILVGARYVANIGGTINGTAATATDVSCGVCASSSDIFVCGGTLNGTGGTASPTNADSQSIGVYAAGTITTSGGTMTGSGGAASKDSCGVCAANIIASDTGMMTGNGGLVTGDDGKSFGVCATNIDVSGSGAINGNGGAASPTNFDRKGASYGVYANGGIDVPGGALTGFGGTAPSQEGNSYGVYASGSDITVNGGTLTGTGGTAGTLGSNNGYNSYGVRALNGNIMVSSGSLIGKGGAAITYAIGVNAANGNIEVSGTGALTGIGGTALNKRGYSHGVAAEKGVITVSGGAFTGKGGEENGEKQFLYNVGVSAINNITVSGGKFTAIGGSATGGTDSDPSPTSLGMYYGSDTNISGGSFTASGDIAAMAKVTDTFIYNAPVLGYPSNAYRYRTANSGGYTSGAATPYVRDASYKYLEFTDKEPSAPSSGSSGGGSYTVNVYNAANPQQATIWLSGAGLNPNDLLITPRLSSGSAYNAMLKLAGGNDVFSAYDISLSSGTRSTGSALYLHFDLAAKYAGQTFTLVHQKADGTYEYFTAIADANGDLTFGPLDSLSPFMLVHGALSGQPVTMALPKTGERTAALGYLLLAAGLALPLLRKKRRA